MSSAEEGVKKLVAAEEVPGKDARERKMQNVE
jgi:hypothetical protein